LVQILDDSQPLSHSPIQEPEGFERALKIDPDPDPDLDLKMDPDLDPDPDPRSRFRN
jgi:hypothetical protein